MFEFYKNKDIVFVDIEANDKPKRILQFGAIKILKDGQSECRNWFSNPKCKITSHIEKMVEKNLKNIENGMTSIRIAEKIYNFLKNTILITYGPFDYDFLKNFCYKLLKKKLDVTHIDLQYEWKKLSMYKNLWSLNRLANFFSISIQENQLHDAFYDAKTLHDIYMAWLSKDKDNLMDNIYCDVAKFEKRIKATQNNLNKNAFTLNNTSKNEGLCLLKINFEESRYTENSKQLLSGLDVLEIVGNQIKRNWNFQFDINGKDFDSEIYEITLTNILKKLIVCITDKKLLVDEHEYQKLIKLVNLCAQYVDVFPINNIGFTIGYSNLFHKIDVSAEKYMHNLELIKNWKVYEYLKEKNSN